MAVKDYYKTLGVDPKAEPDVITAAYKALVKKYHPDRNPGNLVAEAKTKEINEAYETLGTEEKRKKYDAGVYYVYFAPPKPPPGTSYTPPPQGTGRQSTSPGATSTPSQNPPPRTNPPPPPNPPPRTGAGQHTTSSSPGFTPPYSPLGRDPFDDTIEVSAAIGWAVLLGVGSLAPAFIVGLVLYLIGLRVSGPGESLVTIVIAFCCFTTRKITGYLWAGVLTGMIPFAIYGIIGVIARPDQAAGIVVFPLIGLLPGLVGGGLGGIGERWEVPPLSTVKATIGKVKTTIGKVRISRRIVLIGVGTTAFAAIGGGIFAILRPLIPMDFTYEGHSDAIAWSPDGKRIASGSDDATVQVWNANDGDTIFTYRGHSNAVRALAWLPDGKRIASISDDEIVHVWNVIDGSNVSTYKGHAEGVRTIAWSPDGKRIASGSDDKTVHVWNASDGNNVLTYREHSEVTVVAWSPDSKRIASSSSFEDRIISVWNAQDGESIFTYKGHYNESTAEEPASVVTTIAWSPDGKRIASGAGLGPKGVQVWRDGSNMFTYYTEHSDGVDQIVWSPDSKRLAASSYRKVEVWFVD